MSRPEPTRSSLPELVHIVRETRSSEAALGHLEGEVLHRSFCVLVPEDYPLFLVDRGAEAKLGAVDWRAAVESLAGPGWVRLKATLDGATCTRLRESAALPWSPLVEDEAGTGVVRQSGLSCHTELSCAAPIVRSLANMIETAVNGVRPTGLAELPRFNHAQWGKSADGVGFITAHRDPSGAGGIIAITTLAGSARFRVWDDDGITDLPSPRHERCMAREWDTVEGDLVLLRGRGWPNRASRCPVHEVESPEQGDRMILTLRHNKEGYGANYFTSPS